MKRSGHHAVMLNRAKRFTTAVHVNNYHSWKAWQGTEYVLLDTGRVIETNYHPVGNEDAWVVNIEDSQAPATTVKEHLQLWPDAEHVLVIRNPYNQTASRAEKSWPISLNMWVQYARLAAYPLPGLSVVIFDHWIKDNPQDEVAPYGGGSSFRSLEGVQHRWKKLRGTAYANDLINHDDVNRWAWRLFGADSITHIIKDLKQHASDSPPATRR